MKYDHFLINYNGNKYQETKKYYKNLTEQINFKSYDIIAEAFCGIFGFTRAVFEKENFSDDLENTPEFWLNDIDKNLINTIEILKNNPEEYLNNILEFAKKFETDKEFTAFMRTQQKNDDLFYYIVRMTFRNASPNIMNFKKGEIKIKNYLLKSDEFKKLFERVKLFNLDVSEFYEKLPKDKKILLFLDPPYFNSDNSGYSKYIKDTNEEEIPDGTKIYVDCYHYLENKNMDVVMVLNNLYIFRCFYTRFVWFNYGRTYQNNTGGKKNANHMFFSNIHIK